jgi:hypothetical protein
MNQKTLGLCRDAQHSSADVTGKIELLVTIQKLVHQKLQAVKRRFIRVANFGPDLGTGGDAVLVRQEDLEDASGIAATGFVELGEILTPKLKVPALI